jgi:hypothetical protein
MVIRFPDGSATTFDFREKAPLAAHPEMWLDEDGEYAPGPGTTATWPWACPGRWRASRTPTSATAAPPWGSWWSRRWPWPTTASIRGAASLARSGQAGHAALPGQMRRSPGTASPTRPASAGASRTWPGPWSGSATTGATASIAGETARLLVAEMERGGGIITSKDLARYRGGGAGAHPGQLPRLRRHRDAAAEQRRDRPGPDAQHPGGLRPGGHGPQQPPYIHHLTEASASPTATGPATWPTPTSRTCPSPP